MAFPQTVTPTGQTFNSGTTHTLNLPATVNAGDLLLIIVSTDLGSTPTLVAAGFTKLGTSALGSDRWSVWGKVAAGTEGGTTVNCSTGVSDGLAAHIYRITAWRGSFSVGTNGVTMTFTASANAGPPNHSVPGGAALDYLWIACVANPSTATVFGTAPTNYLEDLSSVGNSVRRISSANRELNASAEDPGSWSGGGDARQVTIAVWPAVVILNYTVTPTGGVIVGGASGVVNIKVTVTTGGAVVGGASGVAKTLSVVPTGGVIAGGVPAVTKTLSVTPTGGVVVGGVPAVSNTIAISPTGGAILGGTSPVAMLIIPPTNGGVVVGGSPPVALTLAVTPTGGVVAGGTPGVQETIVIMPTGGVVAGGAGQVAYLLVVEPDGGVVVGGAVEVEFVSGDESSGGNIYRVTTEGGIVAGGESLVEFVQGLVVYDGISTLVFQMQPVPTEHVLPTQPGRTTLRLTEA